jgi:predicted nucleic acid-binding protein
VSAVSYVEVLGYHQLDDEEQQYLEEFFRLAQVLPLSQAVLDQAVALRQQRKMSRGDALVAGTALVHGLTLVTRNSEDFHWIQGLSLLNPFDEEPQQEQEPQS